MALLHKFVTWGFGNLGVVLSESDPVSYVFVFRGNTNDLLEDEVYVKTKTPDHGNSVLYDFLISEKVTMSDNAIPVRSDLLHEPLNMEEVENLMAALRADYELENSSSSEEEAWEDSSSSEDY